MQVLQMWHSDGSASKCFKPSGILESVSCKIMSLLAFIAVRISSFLCSCGCLASSGSLTSQEWCCCLDSLCLFLCCREVCCVSTSLTSHTFVLLMVIKNSKLCYHANQEQCRNVSAYTNIKLVEQFTRHQKTSHKSSVCLQKRKGDKSNLAG